MVSINLNEQVNYNYGERYIIFSTGLTCLFWRINSLLVPQLKRDTLNHEALFTLVKDTRVRIQSVKISLYKWKLDILPKEAQKQLYRY